MLLCALSPLYVLWYESWKRSLVQASDGRECGSLCCFRSLECLRDLVPLASRKVLYFAFNNKPIYECRILTDKINILGEEKKEMTTTFVIAFNPFVFWNVERHYKLFKAKMIPN